MADINARNSEGETELHKKVLDNDLPAVTHLLSNGDDVNVPDNDGNTPLHKASGQSVLQALLAFGGNTHLINSKNENPRHIVATSSYEDKDEMLYILYAVGAPRCKTHVESCTEGCALDGKDNGKPPCVQCISRDRHSFDDVLENAMLDALKPAPSKGGRILCLDGGGMKGLVLIQILMAIQEASGGRPILDLFDWIAGTSTGGILATNTCFR
ncbi:unnamed protein product [Meganyctiphanes norvegica]|uniref:phospholipase A2 n=1 Tax=Meganyctiphanes norvegica TaxID=48144 RepID=A0AAV2R1E1_MEGNR